MMQCHKDTEDIEDTTAGTGMRELTRPICHVFLDIYGDCIIEFDKIFLSPHFCDGVFCPLWLFELPPLAAKLDNAKPITAKPSKTEPLWRGAVCSWLQIVARTKRRADWPGSARVDNLQKTAMMASTHWYTASWLISRDVIVIKLSWNVLWIWHLGFIACKKSNTWFALSQVKIRETHNEKGWRAFLSCQVYSWAVSKLSRALIVCWIGKVHLISGCLKLPLLSDWFPFTLGHLLQGFWHCPYVFKYAVEIPTSCATWDIHDNLLSRSK